MLVAFLSFSFFLFFLWLNASKKIHLISRNYSFVFQLHFARAKLNSRLRFLSPSFITWLCPINHGYVHAKIVTDFNQCSNNFAQWTVKGRRGVFQNQLKHTRNNAFCRSGGGVIHRNVREFTFLSGFNIHSVQC